MDLNSWNKGLIEYFKNQQSPVRLFDADGYVFGEVYNQRKEASVPNLPIDECYRDFLLAIIDEVFTNSKWRNYFLHKGNISVKKIASWVCCSDGCRWQLLPLCVFFSTLWAYQFKDENKKEEELKECDDPQQGEGNDSNYRGVRLPDALAWAVEERKTPIPQFDVGTDHFSNGIINLFKSLECVFPGWMNGRKLFMPDKNLKYRDSLADGITISHAIFRFGEIARVYNNFGRHNLSLGQQYHDEEFKRVAESCRFNESWMKERNVSPDELIKAIAKLFEVWDGYIDEEIIRTANVDWYLNLNGANGRYNAQYIAGFDHFPQKKRMLRDFKIIMENDNCKKKKVPSLSALTWSEPLPWNQDVRVEYDGNCRHSLKSNEIDGEIELDESCLFHSVETSFGVFVRYRSNKKNSRYNWWKRYDWNELPELGCAQKDFLICARDEDAFQNLKLQCESNEIKWEESEIKSFTISSPDKQDLCSFPFRIYSVENRSENQDAEIIVFNGEKEERRIKIRGKTPRIEVDSNERDCFLSSQGENSYCLSMADEIILKVQFPRENKEYSWMLDVDGIIRQFGIGNTIRVKIGDNEGVNNNCIVPFRLSCVEKGEDSSKSIGCIKGVLLPDDVMRNLCAGAVNNIGNWKVENAAESCASRISDRIERIRRFKITDPNNKICEVFMPDEEFGWWFESGLNSFRDMEPMPQLHDKWSKIEEFEAIAIHQKYLCLPSDIIPCDQEGWSFVSGYWRVPLYKLLDRLQFCYDPKQGMMSYCFERNGETFELFKYKFEPRRIRLCKDRDGNLGVFVPADDTSEYEVRAFSDKSCVLLLDGVNLLDGINSQTRFINIQEKWDEFCKQVQGRDALLSVLKVNQLCGNKIYNTISDNTINLDERFFLHNGVENISYKEEELKVINSLKTVLPILRSGGGEDHPIWRMRFFTTQQTQSYETVKSGWRVPVDMLINAGCKDSVRWNKLLKEWEESGFYPLIEGVATELYQKIKGLFSMVQLQDPFEEIDQTSDAWKMFIKKYLDVGLNGGRNDIRNLTIWPDGFRRTDNRMDGFITVIQNHCNEWSALKKCTQKALGQQSPNKVLLQNLQREVRQRYNITEEWLLGRVLYCALLNNHVRADEMTISRNLQGNPKDLFDRLFSGQGEMFIRILDRLATNRQVANLPNDDPTDREWIFCLAAVTVLIDENVQIEEDERNVLVQIFNIIRVDDAKWTSFIDYQGKCRSIQMICNEI